MVGLNYCLHSIISMYTDEKWGWKEDNGIEITENVTILSIDYLNFVLQFSRKKIVLWMKKKNVCLRQGFLPGEIIADDTRFPWSYCADLRLILFTWFYLSFPLLRHRHFVPFLLFQKPVEGEFFLSLSRVIKLLFQCQCQPIRDNCVPFQWNRYLVCVCWKSSFYLKRDNDL